SSSSWVLPAARVATDAPVATDPMKPTAAMPGWPASASPATGPGPGTKLNTPAGASSAAMISASRAQQAVVVGAGTPTTALPAARRRHRRAPLGPLEGGQRRPGGPGGLRRRDGGVDVAPVGHGHRGERLARGGTDGRDRAPAAVAPGAADVEQVLAHGMALFL